MKFQQQHWLEETIDINLNFLSAKIQSNNNNGRNINELNQLNYKN